LLLAVHYGLDIYYYNHNKSQNPTSILSTLVYFLEFGISKSPSNYHFKFLLTRLYQLLGSFTSYGPHLKALDIKQIQLDTLSHSWIHHTNYLGHWKQIEKEDSQCNFIYRSNEKETIDMIRLCFKNGTYSKVIYSGLF
jgi:N-terminal acetyltransferase B complex non-catalytic subunit